MYKKILPAALLLLTLACNQSPTSKEATSTSDTTRSAAAFNPSTIQEQVVYGRALQAIMWGMPMVNSDMMFQAAGKAGGKQNELVYWSGPSDWKNQTLTPNGDAIYFMPFVNTKEVGPMVLELPPAGADGSIVGSYMDYWQMAIEDVGTAGVDKGKGGKYLVLPPDYKGKIPAGYIPLPSFTFQSYALLRSIPKSTDEADTKAAVEYGKRIKLYPLSTASNPPNTTMTDVRGQVFDSTIPYDVRFFESLSNMVQVEPWLQRDKVMIDQLKSIGIEKGKSFSPDVASNNLLVSAAKNAKAWLDDYYEHHFTPHYTDAHWFLPGDPIYVKQMENSYGDSDLYPVDARACTYYCAFTSLKHLGAGQFYLFVSRDKNDKPLDGGKNYVLHVPANVPVHQYWSLTLYDFDTHAFIRDVAYPSRSSLNPALQKNADGSVDLFTGPSAPAGKESNWIPTKADGRFEGLFRFYGPEKGILDKSWKLPDFEEAK